MSPSLPPVHSRARLAHAAPALLAAAVLSSCVDGEPFAPNRAALVIRTAPVFTVVPTAEEIEKLDWVRVTIHDVEGDRELLRRVRQISPSSPQWTFELDVDVDPDRALSLRVQAELIDIDGTGQETVEFSGRTELEVRASFEPEEVRQLQLYRGPLDNLDLTGVEFDLNALGLSDGEQLRVFQTSAEALPYTLTGDNGAARMYLRSENTSVVRPLDGGGSIQGEGLGVAKVIVFGGRVADTLEVAVTRFVKLDSDPTTLAQIQEQVGPQLDYVTSSLFLGTFGDRAGADSIFKQMKSLEKALVGGRPAPIVESYESLGDALDSYGRGTPFRTRDGPQLGVVEISKLLIANSLKMDLE